MKRLLSVILASIMILCMFSVTGFAEGGLDANEERVVSALRQSLTLPGTDVTYTIPEKYVIQAENYFLQYEGMTEEDADTIISYLQQAADLFLAQAESIYDRNEDEFNLRSLPNETKAGILELGQKASEIVGLKLVYNNNVVTITGSDGTTFFSNRAVVKKTGLLDGALIYAVCGLAVVILAAAAGMYFWTKKRGAGAAA